MHILFVHQNYPAQFGQTARWLVSRLGWQCTFVSEEASGSDGGVQCVRYQVAGGATELTHYCSRTFENTVWRAYAVYEACKQELSSVPDLIVGHSGLTSTLFLRNLFECPVINYFEILLPPARRGHRFPAGIPGRGTGLPSRADAQRDDPAGSGKLRRRLLCD